MLISERKGDKFQWRGGAKLIKPLGCGPNSICLRCVVCETTLLHICNSDVSQPVNSRTASPCATSHVPQAHVPTHMFQLFGEETWPARTTRTGRLPVPDMPNSKSRTRRRATNQAPSPRARSGIESRPSPTRDPSHAGRQTSSAWAPGCPPRWPSSTPCPAPSAG